MKWGLAAQTAALTIGLPVASCSPDMAELYTQRVVEEVGPASLVEVTDYPTQDGQEVKVQLEPAGTLGDLVELGLFGPLRPGDSPEEAAAKLQVSSSLRETEFEQEHVFGLAGYDLAIGRVETSGRWSGWSLYLYPEDIAPSAYIPAILLECCVDVRKTYSHVTYMNPDGTPGIEVQLSGGEVRRLHWINESGAATIARGIEKLVRQ